MQFGFKIKSIWALTSMLGWALKLIYITMLTPGLYLTLILRIGLVLEEI